VRQERKAKDSKNRLLRENKDKKKFLPHLFFVMMAFFVSSIRRSFRRTASSFSRLTTHRIALRRRLPIEPRKTHHKFEGRKKRDRITIFDQRLLFFPSHLGRKTIPQSLCLFCYPFQITSINIQISSLDTESLWELHSKMTSPKDRCCPSSRDTSCQYQNRRVSEL
jgi:hypothetical protein